MTELSSSPFFLLLLLIGCFEGCVILRNKFRNQLINPTLITTIIVIGVLSCLDIQWQTFETASSYLTFWLSPAVVCLAVPLYIEWQKIRSQWLAILGSQFIGSLVGIISGIWLVKILGGSQTLQIAIAAKSVTMPIAIEVTNKLNGVIGITSGAVLIAGVVGQVLGIWILKISGIYRPMAKGLAMGTASHALGTVRVMQMSMKFVAYATLGLILNGILTAFLAPLVVPYIM